MTTLLLQHLKGVSEMPRITSSEQRRYREWLTRIQQQNVHEDGERCSCCGSSRNSFFRGLIRTQVILENDERNTDVFLCQSCHDTHNHCRCRACNLGIIPGQEILAELHGEPNTTWCRRCHSRYYQPCDECNTMVFNDNRRSVLHVFEDGEAVSRMVCNTCSDTHYTRCDTCDTLQSTGAMIQRHNRTICHRCDENIMFDNDGDIMVLPKNQIITHYRYRPDKLIFNKNDEQTEMYFGIELEIDGAGERHDYAHELMKMVHENAKYQMAYIKHDGSLESGFEIVTQPCSYDFHANSFPWAEVMNLAREMGYESKPSCGLHIHVSRKYFGRTTERQDEKIAKVIYIVEKFWAQIVKFSRRTEAKMHRWARRYMNDGWERRRPDLTPSDMLNIAYRSHNRYACVNLRNEHTIEFRMFRGTMQKDVLFSALQFVKLICEIANEKSVNELNVMTWGHIVNEAKRREYTLLMKYFKSRNLIPQSTEPLQEQDIARERVDSFFAQLALAT